MAVCLFTPATDNSPDASPNAGTVHSITWNASLNCFLISSNGIDSCSKKQILFTSFHNDLFQRSLQLDEHLHR